MLQRFDEWYYEGGDPPASWIRFKENQAMKIRSPEDFVRIFAACAKFVAAEIKKNSSYEPPMEFLKIAMWFKRLIEDSREVVPPEPNKRLKGGVAV